MLLKMDNLGHFYHLPLKVYIYRNKSSCEQYTVRTMKPYLSTSLFFLHNNILYLLVFSKKWTNSCYIATWTQHEIQNQARSAIAKCMYTCKHTANTYI